MGNMSREETVSLLVELVSVCRTFLQATIVSLIRDGNSGRWGLSAKWIAQGEEKECLDRVAKGRGYGVAEINGYTILQKT